MPCDCCPHLLAFPFWQILKNLSPTCASNVSLLSSSSSSPSHDIGRQYVVLLFVPTMELSNPSSNSLCPALLWYWCWDCENDFVPLPAVPDRFLPIGGTRGSLGGWNREEGFVPLVCCLGQPWSFTQVEAVWPRLQHLLLASSEQSHLAVLRGLSAVLWEISSQPPGSHHPKRFPWFTQCADLTASCNYHLCDIQVSPFFLSFPTVVEPVSYIKFSLLQIQWDFCFL